MGNRRDRKEYLDAEADFLINTIDLEAVVEDLGYVYSKAKSTRDQPAYIRGDRKLTVRIGEARIWIWVDLSDIHNSGGTIVQFMMMEYGCDEKGAFDKLREIAETKYSVDYQLFKDGFYKKDRTSLQPRKKVIRPGAAYAVFDFETYMKEKKPSKKEFTFEPATSFEFLLSRGITMETLEDPLFQGRLGNATGPFGNTELKRGVLGPEDFEFPNHIIIPFWDVDGKIVALEAKNKLTEAAFQKEIDWELENGGSAANVRRNASKFYKDSSKQGAWLSNIPHQAVAIFISEQIADALAYFQLHRDDPATLKTIYMTTGGTMVEGHYAILHKLIRDHGINRVILGFDRDLAGLKYSLLTIQNLPFVRKEDQKYGLTFGTSERFEMELGVVLQGELQLYNTDDLLVAFSRIKLHIEEHFFFEGKVEFFPALSLSSKLATITIPYTPKNADEILRLAHAFLKTEYGKFELRVPRYAKDWNDHLRGIETDPPTPSKLFYDQPSTRNQIFIQNNVIVFQQRLVSFDHNIKEVVGKINPFANRYFVKPSASLLKHKFLMQALEKLQEDYVSHMPLLKEGFVLDAVKRNIHYTLLDGRFRNNDTLLAQWSPEKNDIEPLVYLEPLDRAVLTWMAGAIREGRDPNVPEIALDYDRVAYRGEVIGVIGIGFTFQESEGFSISKLDEGGIAQLHLLLMELDKVRRQWELFREKYSEPVQYYTSANLVLKENQNPLYRFVPGRNQVELICDAEKLAGRAFNPFFYKALQLFAENHGVFYNYTRRMRVDTVNNTIFYRTRGQEIGRIIRDGDSTYFALYPDVPETMKREMTLMAPFREAPIEVIEKHNVSLKPSVLQGEIKEDKISTIPLPYLRFYDERGKRFVPLSEDKLKKLLPSSHKLYTEAYLWHLNHIGNPNPAFGSEKERFYEKDGTVYFNRIPVAFYNPEADILESVAPPSGKFFQYLAIFERNLVQDPTHRKYSGYLTAESEIKQEPLPKSEILAYLSRIEKGADNRLRLVNDQFKLVELGYVDGKSLVIGDGFQQYSEAFTEAMNTFAKGMGYDLQWDAHEEPVAVRQNLSSIEIEAPKVKFNLDFRLTPAGVLQSIVSAPVFYNKLKLDDSGELTFSFLPTKEGQKSMKYSDNFEALKEPQFWMSRQIDKPTTLVLTRDPQQVIHYYQYNLPESMDGRELYMSLMNYDLKLGISIVEKMIESSGIRALHIVGEDAFTNEYRAAFSKKENLGVLALPLITPEQSKGRFTSFISGFEPKPELQHVVAGVAGHNLLNPADGIVLFPMKGPSSSSRAVLGAQMFLSKDADALWFSRPLQEANRIVMVANPEEAVYYLAVNKDFVRDEAVVAFQNTVTDSQVKYLSELLRQPRFFERLAVANSFRLSEQLLDRQFRLPFVIEKPLHETSFQKEFEVIAAGYEDIKRDMRLSRRPFVQEVQDQGKSKAPVAYGQAQEQEVRIGK